MVDLHEKESGSSLGQALGSVYGNMATLNLGLGDLC